MAIVALPEQKTVSEILNVLLVEDDHNDHVAIVNALRRHDFEQFNITLTVNLSECLESLASQRFDLVIADLTLSDGEPETVICRLAAFSEKVPIIVLTNINDERVFQMAISVGIEDYFAKSYMHDVQLLYKTINFSIERHRIKSHLRLARSEHERLATHDIICNIPNRLLFLDRLDRMIARCEHHDDSMALVFVDLDGFKPINDGVGHDAGDHVLSVVARRIQEQLRDSDTVARVGGDEFALLIPFRGDSYYVDQVLQNIKRVISQPVMYQKLACSVTASIGVARYPKDADNRQSLMQFADFAMLEAKTNGGNRIRYFRESMAHSHHLRCRLEEELRDALDNNQLELCYQPVIELENGDLYGIEAVMNWPRSGEVMCHTDILRVSERSRLLVRLGHYMLDRLRMDIERLAQSGAKRLMINTSAAQLRHSGFFDSLLEVANFWHGLERQFCVEIAEPELAIDRKSLVPVVRKLAKHRLKLVLDHFGIDQASLSYLKKFDIDGIKIDESYLCDQTSSMRDSQVLKAIVGLVNELKLDCIAVGVENAGQDACLKEIGCRLAQGPYYSRQLNVGELPRHASNLHLLHVRK